MSTAIKIENLWKQYRLGVIGHQYLVKDVQSWWARVRGKEDPNTPVDLENSGNGSTQTLWALRDISLDVGEGEVLGIIGKNGAGKSTLLKILSRVTAPTKGSVKIKGRVASLLEVGTGFHHELTGSENVFLNGAILGMSVNEVKRKFDQIVDFSGVEKFIDTPVKRYSSGMYVRLAFAVAAHLDSEILILDEVLAVGDAAFQKKCLTKMDQVANQGRTILFVSHNLASVTKLCSRAVVLDKGALVSVSENAAEAAQEYTDHFSGIEKSSIPISEREDRQGEGHVRIVGFGAFGPDGAELSTLTLGQPVEFRIYYQSRAGHDPKNFSACISISSLGSGFVTSLGNLPASGEFPTAPTSGFIACKLERLPLSPGRYSLNLSILEYNVMQDWIIDAVLIAVEEGDFFGTGRLWPPSHHGVLYTDQVWSLGPR